jgi:molybdopterin-guanine dinucleotide biosynthesis protein A
MPDNNVKHVAGIILAGGHSRRMGTDKAMLPFGSEQLLQRIARIVSQATSPVVVVAQQSRALPALPPEVVVVCDENPDRGPLEGIAAGLRVLQKSFTQTKAAFITGCDAPLLTATYIEHIVGLLDAKHDAVVPVYEKIPQPLTGVYRTKILPIVDQLLASNRLSLRDLLDHIAVHFVSTAELRQADPDLLSLRNLNTPADYHAALATAGFTKDNQSL